MWRRCPRRRGRGIATAVTLAALREAQRQGETVGVLHASEMAHSVYRRMGFVAVLRLGLLPRAAVGITRMVRRYPSSVIS